ncbi:hypothetical protein BHM03_00020030 [Ensete ventricosum]|nr:hypothetical protein BHM03_00020030 [Ensete ventricosum]
MSTSLVWQPSRSTSLALAVAIASIRDTICLIVAYHRLTIPLCIVSTPPKKGPQHCGPEVREEREAHLHYSGFLIFSFGNLPIAPAVAASPPPKSIVVRPSPRLTTQWSP